MIPKWNHVGALPPIWPGMQGHSIERSPYHVAVNFSEKRRIILKGLLNYRKALSLFSIDQTDESDKRYYKNMTIYSSMTK